MGMHYIHHKTIAMAAFKVAMAALNPRTCRESVPLSLGLVLDPCGEEA
jgi:hypothetical protein